MIAVIVTFSIVSLFLFIMLLGTYAKLTKHEQLQLKRLEQIERETTMIRDVVISHNDTITKYVEVADYLLIRDGGAGVYMGERGDA